MPDIWYDGVTLRQWRLHSFKSVRDATVDLAPLTIVVGENSAGKSTLLQSIRAVVQAVNASGAAFPLNGEHVRLGTYAETRHVGAPADDAQIGVGGIFHLGARRRLTSGPVRSGARRPDLHRTARPTVVDWAIRLEGSPPEQPGQTILRSGRTTAQTGDDPPIAITSTARPGGRGPGDREASYAGSLRVGDDEHELFEVEHLGGFAVRGYQQADLVQHLAERWLHLAQQRAFGASRGEDLLRPGLPAGDIATRAADDIRAVIDEAGDNTQADLLYERRAVALLHDRSQAMPPLPLASLIDAREYIASAVSGLVRVRRQVSRTAEIPESLREATSSVRDFLNARVLHLGPLRMDPQVVYTAAPVGRTGYIGAKGEYCAAVLQTNGRTRVRVPVPRQAGQRVMQLGQAVNLWAKELGIGNEFTTADRGRLGLELAVRQANVDMPLDLTSVGTGVSQLLPVLVMCLQAQPGSLLLLEQPELHLNPAVQQRLADFLLAIADSGRQIIVETHSDYLVSRLRRRVAEDPTAKVRRTVAIVFAERSGGASSYTAIRPGPDGSLPGWPAGFFDQAAEDAEALLAAGLRRRQEKQL